MKLVCAPGGIVDGNRPGQGIMDIAGAGFQGLVCDMALFCGSGELENAGREKKTGREQERPDPRQAFWYEKPEEFYGYMEPMLEKCGRNGLTFPAVSVPRLDADTKRTDLNGLLFRFAKEGIGICARIGCRFLLVPPLFAGIPREELWNVNRNYYLSLAETAEGADVVILLQNLCGSINGHLVRGVCSCAREAAEWVDQLNREAGGERFGFCMDVGTCNLCGQNMYDFTKELQGRLKAVILRDNDGNYDGAMFPFTAVRRGTFRTDWLNLIRGLRDICFDGMLILNMHDTAGAVSPVLRPGLMGFARSVMEYFQWQIQLERVLQKYSSRVLFGAGNMCRNYMKCYGEKYPPLYTCDNDRTLWGETFCGLCVKSPEALKELPPETAVFICNIYYREIEKQLRGMGIPNPIEYFNDEYMPSFYFDRLERERKK